MASSTPPMNVCSAGCGLLEEPGRVFYELARTTPGGFDRYATAMLVEYASYRLLGIACACIDTGLDRLENRSQAQID